MFDYSEARENGTEDEYPINMDSAHAITLAQLGSKTRVYDITPETKAKSQRVESKIKSYVQNTNRVYSAIKQLFVKDDPGLYPEYKRNHGHNLELYKEIKHEDFPLDRHNFTARSISETVSKLLHMGITQEFNFEDSFFLRDHEALGFPFSLVSRLKARHKEHEDSYLSPYAKNNVENTQILNVFGLSLNDKSILRRFLPVSEDAVDILKVITSFKETSPNLMEALINYQKSLTGYLDSIVLMKQLNQRSNGTLRDMLLDSGAKIEEEAFSEIAWLDLIFEEEIYNGMSAWRNKAHKEAISPDEVISITEKQLSEAEGLFNDFVANKALDIQRIFVDPTHGKPPAPESIVASTLLFMNINSNQTRLTEKEKKVELYRKVRKKLSNLFNEYYEENNLKGKLTTML